MSPAKKASGGGRKSTAKKSTTRAAKKPAPKKTSARKATAKKSTKKATGRKPAAAKAKKRTAPRPVARKAPAKKPVAKKVPAKKTPAKKSVAAAPTKKGGAKPTTMPAVAPKRVLPPSRPFVRPTPIAPTKRKVRPAKFDAEQLKKIRGSLETKRGELEARMTELEESFDSTQSDITGEVGLDEDFADAGTATFERERDLSIRNNIRDLVDQMNRAIARIDDGTYGTCERCGQAIDAARLRELPHASLCLDCKRREERAR